MTLAQSTDHEERARAKLLDQFQDKAYLEAVLRAFIFQVQRLEDCAWEVILLRNIDTGEGVQLDAIGRIVGRSRLGLDDPDYRIALRAQIRINRSSGRPEDLIDVTRLSIPAGFTFTYDEPGTAVIAVEIVEEVTFNILVLIGNLIRAKAGGVRLFLDYTSSPREDTFTFAPYSVGAPDVTDLTRGFGNEGDTDLGGDFATVMASS